MGSTDSDEDIIYLYEIGRSMNPSSGIMSSLDDKHDNNPGINISYLDQRLKINPHARRSK